MAYFSKEAYERKSNNGKEGGVLKGKSHKQGGIKAVVTDLDNKPVELEGDEAIIKKTALKDEKVRVRKGTNAEILNDINTEAGGNPIHAPSDLKMEKWELIGDDCLSMPKNTDKERRDYAECILKGLDYEYSSNSHTDYGHSMYFKVGDIKVRFSDHSVTNTVRMNEEAHFKWNDKKAQVEQSLLRLKYLLGDENVVYKKIKLEMPSGNISEVFGYEYVNEMTEGGSICSSNDDFSAIEFLISEGIVELDYEQTTKKHAKEYGLNCENPLYIKRIFVKEKYRLNGIGKMLLKYLDSIASKNGNDCIFGYVEQKAKFTRDNRPCYFNDTTLFKYWLHGNGYAINDENNDFHKVISDNMEEGGTLKNVELSNVKEMPDSFQNLFNRLYVDSKQGILYNKVKLENEARKCGVLRENDAKEVAEFTIVNLAREISLSDSSIKEKYNSIVELYKNQVNLSHRTSESIMYQQYSTPAPLGYLMGIYCGMNKKGKYFEPSAGNGLLTIAAEPVNFTVNEIDDIRNNNLSVQGFSKVMKTDASTPFIGFEKSFDAIITNPPFGATETVMYGDSQIKSLEQVMALRALDTMKDSGRAAIIIGGHTIYDKEGRIQAGKNRAFFVYLYKNYYVEDVINIDGHSLYSRQGTAFNTRIILINGRKVVPNGFPPLIKEKTPSTSNHSKETVTTFGDLYERVINLI